MQRLRKFAAMLLTAVFCLLPVSGMTSVLEETEQRLMGDGAFSLTLSPQVGAYPPFGELRLEQLNLLLNHVTVRCASRDEWSEVAILTDGAETLNLRRKQRDGSTATQLSVLPGITWLDSREAMPGLTGETGAGETWEEIRFCWRLLEEGITFFTRLQERCPEEAGEKTVRQKLRMGTAVRSVSIRIPQEAVREGRMASLTGEAADTPVLQKWLEGMCFRGKQSFTLLFDEENRLLKVQYSGRMGTDEEHLRNVRLEWKCLRDGSSRMDELTLKTPAVDGSERDNWQLSRKWTADEEESFSFSGEYDRKGPEGKRKISWEAALSGAEEISGEVAWTVQEGRDSRKTVLRPVFSVTEEGKYQGRIDILQYSGKILQEELMLSFFLDSEPVVKWEENTSERVWSGDDSESASLREKLAAALLRGLLRIPEQDLVFLSDEIPEEDWQLILNANGR